MRAPRVIVVGHSTSDRAAIFCCADCDTAGSQAVSRLAWRAGTATGVNDVSLTEMPPYVAGVHHLENLPPGAPVTYAIAVAGDQAALPPASAILEPSRARMFRLLPAERPLRVALVSCNGAYEIEDPARRYVMWPRLGSLIEAGSVDLVVYAGDQVYSDPLLERFVPKLDDEGGAPPELFGPLVEEFRRVYVDSWTVPKWRTCLRPVRR